MHRVVMAQWRIGLCSLAVVLLTLAGCGGGDGLDRHRVKGTVTFQGKPLDQGSIEFSPADGQGTISGGSITNGHYDLPADHGLEPGN